MEVADSSSCAAIFKPRFPFFDSEELEAKAATPATAAATATPPKTAQRVLEFIPLGLWAMKLLAGPWAKPTAPREEQSLAPLVALGSAICAMGAAGSGNNQQPPVGLVFFFQVKRLHPLEARHFCWHSAAEEVHCTGTGRRLSWRTTPFRRQPTSESSTTSAGLLLAGAGRIMGVAIGTSPLAEATPVAASPVLEAAVPTAEVAVSTAAMPVEATSAAASPVLAAAVPTAEVAVSTAAMPVEATPVAASPVLEAAVPTAEVAVSTAAMPVEATSAAASPVLAAAVPTAEVAVSTAAMPVEAAPAATSQILAAASSAAAPAGGVMLGIT